MNITKQKSQKTFDKQAADYDTNIQGEHARKLSKPIIENLKNKNIHSILDLYEMTQFIIIHNLIL